MSARGKGRRKETSRNFSQGSQGGGGGDDEKTHSSLPGTWVGTICRIPERPRTQTSQSTRCRTVGPIHRSSKRVESQLLRSLSPGADIRYPPAHLVVPKRARLDGVGSMDSLLESSWLSEARLGEVLRRLVDDVEEALALAMDRTKRNWSESSLREAGSEQSQGKVRT